MTRKKAIEVLKRRMGWLRLRIDDAAGNGRDLSFDRGEYTALRVTVDAITREAAEQSEPLADPVADVGADVPGGGAQ